MSGLRPDFCWEMSKGAPTIESATVLLWNGFEERSTKFARSSSFSDVHDVFCFCFSDNQFDLSENNKRLERAIPSERLTRVPVDRQKQFLTYQKVFEILSALPAHSRIVFDITCFPRDILLIILYTCWQVGRIENLCCVYNLASDYSYETHEKRQKWLSKGVSNVSPVIGYRGVVRPDRKLQLIGLVGFDDQRVLQIADILSPSSFVFAHGDTGIKNREWLISQSRDAVQILMAQFTESSQDSFVCESGKSVFDVIERARQAKPRMNQVVIPMNNKISTLFAGTYCLINRDVQICYGGALIYNHSNYSMESDTFFHWVSTGL